MPIMVQCLHCGKQLRAPDNLAGKRVKCPGCQNPISVPMAGGVMQRAPAAVQTAPSPGAEASDPGWAKVQTGLRYVRLGAGAGVLGAFLSLLVGVGLATGGLSAKLANDSGLGSCVYLGTIIMFAVGLFYCAGAPAESGLKGLSLTAAIMWATCCLSPIGFILFPFVLRSIGKSLNNPSLSSGALIFLAVSLVLGCLGCGTPLGVFFATGYFDAASSSDQVAIVAQNPAAYGGGNACQGITLMAMWIWLILLVSKAQKTIRAATGA